VSFEDDEQRRARQGLHALFTSNEPRLRAFAMSLIPNWADAEDVMQQANLVLWSKFEQFELGTDFYAWPGGSSILSPGLSQAAVTDEIRFSDEFFDAVAEEAQNMSEELDDRKGR